jgi:hypothetical protein
MSSAEMVGMDRDNSKPSRKYGISRKDFLKD